MSFGKVRPFGFLNFPCPHEGLGLSSANSPSPVNKRNKNLNFLRHLVLDFWLLGFQGKVYKMGSTRKLGERDTLWDKISKQGN